MLTVLLVLRLRNRIRLSLTAIRTSQVENFEFPWNWSSFSYAFRKASCVMSSASSRFLRNVLRYAKDLAIVLTHQLLKGRSIALFCARYERNVRVNLFRNWRLDGWHMDNGAESKPESVAPTPERRLRSRLLPS